MKDCIQCAALLTPFYLGLKFMINELTFMKVLIKSIVSAKRLSHSPLPDETTTLIPEPWPFQFTTSSWTYVKLTVIAFFGGG